jgi:hypothetical protein
MTYLQDSKYQVETQHQLVGVHCNCVITDWASPMYQSPTWIYLSSTHLSYYLPTYLPTHLPTHKKRPGLPKQSSGVHLPLSNNRLPMASAMMAVWFTLALFFLVNWVVSWCLSLHDLGSAGGGIHIPPALQTPNWMWIEKKLELCRQVPSSFHRHLLFICKQPQ